MTHNNDRLSCTSDTSFTIVEENQQNSQTVYIFVSI
jgi:hypothetical protein